VSSEQRSWWEPVPFTGPELVSLGGMQNSGILSGVSTFGKAAAPSRAFSVRFWPGGSPRKEDRGRFPLSCDARIFSKIHIAVAGPVVLTGGKAWSPKVPAETGRGRSTPASSRDELQPGRAGTNCPSPGLSAAPALGAAGPLKRPHSAQAPQPRAGHPRTCPPAEAGPLSPSRRAGGCGGTPYRHGLFCHPRRLPPPRRAGREGAGRDRGRDRVGIGGGQGGSEGRRKRWMDGEIEGGTEGARNGGIEGGRDGGTE